MFFQLFVSKGGNTGLVGGSVPVERGSSELVLSLKKMNQINKIEADSGIVVAEAGCVLQQLNESVSTGGWMVPLDLGTLPSLIIRI